VLFNAQNKDAITICQENLKDKGQNKGMTQIGSSILGPSCNFQCLFVTVSCASMNKVAICIKKREENQLIVYYKHLTEYLMVYT
jgi:hypothetical protein